MTQLLEEVIAKLKALSDDEQDAIVAMILEEIEEKRHCDRSFANSSDILAQLANEAMAEYYGIDI